MAEKKDYIALCRYYKGEDVCPLSGEKALLWGYEESWVEMNLSQSPILSGVIEDFVGEGLAMFRIHDGVPLSLQALLFSRYCHGLEGALCEHVDDFKEWYVAHYL